MHRPATPTATTVLRVPGTAARPDRRRRGLAAVAVVLAASATGLAACSTQSPYQTQAPYLPADGANTRIGSVEARNLVLIAPSKNATAVMTGSLINTGRDPVTVTFLTTAQAQQGTAGSSTPAGGASVQLKGYEQARLTGVQFPSLPVLPGALATVVLQAPGAGQANVDVPVLLPDGYYATVTATPVATATGG